MFQEELNQGIEVWKTNVYQLDSIIDKPVFFMLQTRADQKILMVSDDYLLTNAF